MPELPEVETVRRVTEPQVTGRTVLTVTVRSPQVIAYPDESAFTGSLCGRTIAGMGRRGKYLLFALDNGDRLFLHLRMTGQLLVTPADWPEEKHTHLILGLSDGRQIRYIDLRRFGRFWYIPGGESASVTGIDSLGPEPTDEVLTADYLKRRLGRSSRTVKEALHDQTVVAGIGNIYAAETLFAARIHPERKCCSLTDEEWGMLAAKIPETVSYFTEKNAVTPEEYLAGKGMEYHNTPYLRVYGRGGKPCPVCGTALTKISVGGRGTIFCPVCQKE